ncbi:acyl-CoA dehydrogenase family protein [Sulfuracidifex metallicus]|jgi:alkylation response protein AidB-like acyl-CoA dehydrogenase|uniref:Acyl-CoA dehydrogenase n=1 Tax=Sulfuracidifex metallicus DSM 6482 = JCM 9184 TaxID=523847 RepID=A0A6A9QHL5_SULME|nr:acyl-CoA dehydrogenase family protein [Sulfuracidifex metallicus]MUN28737.1 acyl-CoA dehydrogenase [Sulfuracidifex metallicus DSM 6482 = JCM 9184]WOE50744.1 acyl-CoA dehydrogenase family protein [Sulfuracidifex metallicus DSM 6482 = JCM 9184]
MYELSKEVEEYQAKVREYAQTVVKDYAKKMDETNDGGEKIVQDMGQKGLLGMKIPPNYGGLGLGETAFAIATEELGAESGGASHSLHTQLNALQLLLSVGGDTAKEWIEEGSKGKEIYAVALTEPAAGSDLGAFQTTAKQEGNEFVINGEKIFTSAGSFSTKMVVLARTSGNIGDKQGVSLLLIDSKTSGVEIHKLDLMGIRGAGVSYVKFNNARVPKDTIIGKEGDAYKGAIKALMVSRNGYAGIAVGIARGSLDEAVNRANARKQFGKSLIDQEWIGFNLSDAFIKVEAARLLTLRAAYLFDKGKEALSEASMAKYYAAVTSAEVSRLALHIYGGHGLTRGSKVERLYRDSKVMEIAEGTNEMQLMGVSRLLKKQ